MVRKDLWVAPEREKGLTPVTPKKMRLRPNDSRVTPIIWFDQGGSTGWAVFCFWDDVFTELEYPLLTGIHSWSAGEFYGPEESMAERMVRLAQVFGAKVQVGYEDFHLRRLGGPELLSPVRVAARFEERMLIERLSSKIVPPQQPEIAMSKVTDERQKRWGLWLPGKEHARDAIKHAVTYASRKREVTLKLLRQNSNREKR